MEPRQSPRLSDPIESLIRDRAPGELVEEKPVDIVIVGSGYGGSIAAARLAGERRRVLVLERGREFALGEFPLDLGHVPGHVRFHRADSATPIGYPDALLDLRLGKTMDVLVGNGLGGTSLINANVAYRPKHEEFRDAAWPREIRENPGVLDPGFEAVSTLLNVHTGERQSTPKYEALSVLAEAIRQKGHEAECEPAPLTVTFDDHRAKVAGAQAPCTLCGNCITGCNVGAKNTLMMNALPLAAARGAELYTGVVVLTVRPSREDRRWIIRFRRTASEKTPLQNEVYEVRARDVILAAGTLGSTEILMRSKVRERLRLSTQLGKKFSGNGDAIAFGFAQQRRVHAIGAPVQHRSPREVDEDRIGATISGLIRTSFRDEEGTLHKLTIEDAAVPTSIRRILGDLLTTGALLQRLDNSALPAWYTGRKDIDPIAVDPDAMDHSQILLMMGDDGAGGTLELRQEPPQSPDHARLVVEWPSVGRNPALCAADHLLKQHDRQPGLDGGQYVPNPFWRLLPERASSVLSGPVPAGRALTVHPLGGCGMGNDIRTGVVNHLGQVFKDHPDDLTAVYEGLYVLDGAIIPKSLGFNPLLTISALSWRAAEALRESREWDTSAPRHLRLAEPDQTAIDAERPDSEAIDLVLREQLIGTVDSVPAWLTRINGNTERWDKDKGLILKVDIHVDDLEGWLASGTRQDLRATAELHRNPLDAEATKRLHRVHTPDEELGDETRIAKGGGVVRLLTPDDVWAVRRFGRTVLAIGAYYWRRQPFRSWLANRRKRSNRPGPTPSPTGGSMPDLSFFEKARRFWRLAWEHARYRRLQYHLTFGEGANAFKVDGEKLIAWRPGARRLWDALLTLPIELSGPGASVKGELDMDMTYLVTTGLPQVTASPHLPASVIGLSRLAMLFARAILQTQFWEFAAPDYPDEPIERPTEPLPLQIDGNVVPPERQQLWVPLRSGPQHREREPIRLWLTRYRRPQADARPVLLIHGLAQGSRIYSTDTLDTNMAAAMWRAGFDVWLLDYRLSNMLTEPVPQGEWSMDEIARYDIPAAVQHVFDASGQPVRIFAHCVGATSVAMAILRGWLRDRATNQNMVKCVAFNAIHPWTMPSPVNEFRARFGSFFRDVLGRDMLDPIPVPDPSATQVLVDRLAFAVSRYDEEGGDHRRSRRTEDPATVCDRMTFLYGRMWRHTNLDPRTHAALPTLVGPGAGDVYRQLYYFALHERLTDHEGRNEYLTEDNIRDYWTQIPTFFFHGEESMVFNPASAERSAIRLDAIIRRSGVNPRPPVRLLRVRDFGHMDVVFGRDAHTKVYPLLAQFFEDPWDPGELGDPLQPRHDIDPRRDFRLTAGPILRAAWTADDGTLRVRLWAETNDEVTAIVNGLHLAGAGIVSAPDDQWSIVGREPRYRLLDAQVANEGPVGFNLKAKVGEGAHTAGITDDEVIQGDFAFVYRDTMPWLKRLRDEGRRPCGDMRFLVGSCRYPGTPFESDLSDAVFGGMVPHIEGRSNQAPGVHMLFFIGDQIYADATANILDSRAGRERYGQKYRLAFTSPNARTVLAQIPTHFAIDDHEIADDWSGEVRTSPEYDQALLAAKSFQGSGRKDHAVDRRQKWLSDELWYSLAHEHEHCCPAFVMDTRSQRTPRLYAPTHPIQFVDPAQLAALVDWLGAVNHGPWAAMPKFIFCGVGIAPISRDFDVSNGSTWRSQDWWPGYPAELHSVLMKIFTDNIRNVVFVSGDLHLSSVSRLTLREAESGRARERNAERGSNKAVTVWQIVSSGLYAPMPFASARPWEFDWNRPIRLPQPGAGGVSVVAESGLLYSGQSHVLRVDAERKGAEGDPAAFWNLSIGAVGPGADGAFLQPTLRPPGGVTEHDGRWHIRLA